MTISGGAGRFLITKAGIAGDFSATASINLGDGIQAGPVAVAFAVNTITTAVNESFTVGGKTSTLTLPAGPYLRASLTGLAIEIAGQRVSADFAFEKVMVAGSPVTRISVANFGLRIGADGRDFVVVSDGSGTADDHDRGRHRRDRRDRRAQRPGRHLQRVLQGPVRHRHQERQGHRHGPRARRRSARSSAASSRSRRTPPATSASPSATSSSSSATAPRRWSRSGSPRARSCCATTASPRR